MIRALSVALVSLALAASLGCERTQHEHGPGADHDHGAPAEAERPTLSVTLYQSDLELFMEYPAFTVGQPSPLIAHFTDTRDPNAFRPVTKGRVTAILRPTSGGEERFVAEKPLRDGIFKPEVRPKVAGDATLTLVLEGEQAQGTIEVGRVVVYPDVAGAIAAAPAEEATVEQPMPFLKEQQWKTEYATAPVEVRVLQGGIRATGELRPVAGQAAELSSPMAARIAIGGEVVHLGQTVKKGQILVRLIPTTVASGADLASLELEVERAKAELGLAERDLARAEELLEARAIPEKQLDAARVTRRVAEARLAAAERQRAQYRSAQGGGSTGATFELRAPLDGVVSFADVMPGAVIDPGQRLVSIVNPERLWLEVRVFEADAAKVQRTPGASFTVAGLDREFTVDEGNGRLVAVGAVVDRVTRTVPVLFELANPDGVLKPGMYAKVTLFTGETVRGLTVPESAVVDDGGRPTVFVMEGGESFFKRVIRPGVRSGGFVQVLEGLNEGDRVVSRGAWELKLASSTGTIPEHGHAH